jgi:diguanylate cyclase (GGDEF)-like protein/putative nucleotidyltransferase with HDIG domain
MPSKPYQVKRRAKLYLNFIVALGVFSLGAAAPSFRLNELAAFGCYLALAVATSRLKVSLPGVTGTLSVNFLFMMLGAVSLSPAQAMIIAFAGTAAQCIWGAKVKASAIQLAFNLSNAAISISAAHATFHVLHAWTRRELAPILAAVLVFFVLNTFAVSGIIALTSGSRVLDVWHRSFLWTSPQYLLGAVFVSGLESMRQTFGLMSSMLVLPVIFLVYYSYRLYLDQFDQQRHHSQEMEDLQMRTIRGLAMAIEAKDAVTHEHLRRVQSFAVAIARELNLTKDELRALEAASLLHDIGKLAIPEHILSKPGKLSPEEFAKMKTHPVVGAQILESIGFPYPVVPIVRHHHEKWNGSGYPDGLKGEQIPIGARILAAIDCLDALASDRQYRRSIGLENAMRYVRSESGKSFDPKVVDVLERRLHELEQSISSSDLVRLQKNVEVGKGAAPAAGLEPCSYRSEDPGDPSTFIAAIASARQEFQLLLDVTTELGNSLSVEETLSLLANRLKGMVPYDAVTVFILRGQRLAPQFGFGLDAEAIGSQEIALGEGISGWVAQSGRPILNGNPCLEPGYKEVCQKVARLKSAVSVPLEASGGILGALTLYNAKPDFYNADHLRMLLAVSAKASLTIQNALQFDRAQRHAVTDELTGLPNARSLYLELERELAHCRRSGTGMSVLVLDLDGFKQVNDRFGHLQGNRVLARVAEGLQSCCREYDYVARMGGDEFVVLLRDAMATDLNERIRELQDRVSSSGHDALGERIISLSVGSACYPKDGETAEALLSQADRLMYKNKRAAKVARTSDEEQLVPVR